MTSLDVSAKDIFLSFIALSLLTFTPFIVRSISARIGRVWREEEGPAFGWSEVGLFAALLAMCGVLPAVGLYIGRDLELNHLHDFRSLSGAHHWSITLAQFALVSFGLGLGGLGLILGIVSLLRRPKE